MADETKPLLVITGDTDGLCDPVTGVCAAPAALRPSSEPVSGPA